MALDGTSQFLPKFCTLQALLNTFHRHEADIGKALSFSGVCTVGTQLALFPPLQRILGTAKMYKTLMALWPVVFCFLPIMSYLARIDNVSGRGNDRVWAVMLVFLLVKSTANMCYVGLCKRSLAKYAQLIRSIITSGL